MSIREEFLGALAFAGDLTMGQPPEHSPLTACLAAEIARLDSAPDDVVSRAAQLGLIRWGGCTANAVGFADLFGDDILGRREVLAGRDPFVAKPFPKPPLTQRLAPYLPFFPKPSPEAIFFGKVTPLVYSHCEVVAEIARRAQFSPELVSAIDSLFEFSNGGGWPLGKKGSEYDRCVQYVWLASDLEAYCRFHGLNRACDMVLERGGTVYESELAEAAVGEFESWMSELKSDIVLRRALTDCNLGPDPETFVLGDAVVLLSDFADLKRPEYTGLSRTACDIAEAIAMDLGLSKPETDQLKNGVLLCTLGYVSVNSATLAQGASLSVEAVRLVPYWTERILSRAPRLKQPATIACQVFERLDGSGWHKGLTEDDTGLASRIGQVAVAIAEYDLRDEGSDVAKHLNSDAMNGKMDPLVVNAALKIRGVRNLPFSGDWGAEYQITQREREVLGHLIHGKSNKEIARILSISPKTVGRHLENSYRKLGVTTRAAAAIKALKSGLVAPQA